MNLESMLISVIVPAYNAEGSIARCVESILGQTHHNLEVIVVNDCSGDGTGAVLDRLAAADGRLQVIHGEVNRGVHGARAAGLEVAKGGFIGFVDGDDWIAPGMYRGLLDAVLAEDADIAMCGAVIATGPGETGPAKVRYPSRLVVQDRLLERFCAVEFGSGVLWNKLYRADLIRSAGSVALERGVDAAEDYIVNFGAFAAAQRVVLLPGLEYFYFAHPASASRRESKARNFCRTLRAYVVCLETHATTVLDATTQVDRLYAHQLRMGVYRVDAAAELEPFAGELEETMLRLARVHPAGVHSLVHVFDPAVAGSGRGLRGPARRLLRAGKELGKALVGSRHQSSSGRRQD